MAEKITAAQRPKVVRGTGAPKPAVRKFVRF